MTLGLDGNKAFDPGLLQLMKPEMYLQRMTEPRKQGTPADPATFLRDR